MLIFERSSDDRPRPPEMLRSNLTALSQYYNLYFVAIGTDLYVYKPQFLSQRLHAQPDCVIPLPLSGAQQPGYNNPNNPHAATHIVVGDLGDEEILVCACDDGDVIALTTRSLATGLEAGTTEFLSTLRPFFHCNVRMSAWGIAIHKEARLIAVSANTYEITVFAFALRQEHSPDSPQGSRQDSNVAEDIEDEIFRRAENHWQEAGPAGLNPDRSRDQVVILRGHPCNIPSISFCNTEDDPTGRYLISMDIEGVVVVWRIFEGIYQYYTSLRVAQEHGILIPDNAVWHGWNVLCLNPRSFLPLKTQFETLGFNATLDYDKFSWDITRSQENVTDSSMWHPRSAVPTPASRFPLHLEAPARNVYDDNGTTNSSTPQTISPAIRPTPLPFFLLTCSTTSPTLWSPSTLSGGTPNPATFFRHMLDQHIPASHDWLHSFNRLNMSLQIPTLGIVILASPMGRVALLSLTRLRRTNNCAFRLDWLLPTKSQEDRGERPEVPLLGVAVGPVQGSGAEPKKWRLMLTYSDYSVLSYEIGREGEEVLIF
ncbi:hypothetical protein MMC18_003621 [Xylographa bjoerkii]|nr:hypothetical protein [Xylographa bjoerkii]